MLTRSNNVVISTVLMMLISEPARAEWTPPATGFIYTVIAIVLVATIIALVTFAQRLSSSTNWSLADALSEETDLTVSDANNMPYTVNGVVTELRASSSRVIAFVGMIAILLMFVGFGAFILWGFAITGELPPGASSVVQYLLGGMTLFAPYIVNKFASMFAAK
jgi:hypothetical protein